MDKLQFLPFFRLHSEALKTMLGVKDNRSVQVRLEEIGVPIHGTGINAFIITEEVINALKENDKIEANYIPSKKYW